MQSRDLLRVIQSFLSERFNLGEDRLPEEEVGALIRKGVEFRGFNVWVLVCAIIVASIGLNVNSTAVIIGAMLISPLMGPIMGIGLAVGILDWPLYKKSLKNFLVMVTISLAASTLYFLITPLSAARSELLARTTPAIWDVGIALFGGMAGIVAMNSRERGNVLPGVAIATALMPPLCTAGYGLATAQWTYLAGALYLFFINTVFISLGTLAVTRVLRFRHVTLTDPRLLGRVRRVIWAVVLVTVLPSLFLAWNMVRASLREQSLEQFLTREFQFPGTRVLAWEMDVRARPPRLDVMLVGQPLSPEVKELLRARRGVYQLQEIELVFHQEGARLDDGLLAGRDAGPVQRLPEAGGLLESRLRQVETELGFWRPDRQESARLLREARAIQPGLQDLILAPALRVQTEPADTVLLAHVVSTKGLTAQEQDRLRTWLGERLGQRTVLLRTEP
ncbi:MAG: TIGR00341 family protein [Candidatus Delongbacteria bacterium]